MNHAALWRRLGLVWEGKLCRKLLRVAPVSLILCLGSGSHLGLQQQHGICGPFSKGFATVTRLAHLITNHCLCQWSPSQGGWMNDWHWSADEDARVSWAENRPSTQMQNERNLLLLTLLLSRTFQTFGLFLRALISLVLRLDSIKKAFSTHPGG